MNKYNNLPKEQKNLVLLEIIINVPRSRCDLGNTESVKRIREEIADNVETIVQHAQFLKDSAKLMGINPGNPEEYIAQVILEQRMNIAPGTAYEAPEKKYASF